jgi:hypothetical protein
VQWNWSRKKRGPSVRWDRGRTAPGLGYWGSARAQLSGASLPEQVFGSSRSSGEAGCPSTVQQSQHDRPGQPDLSFAHGVFGFAGGSTAVPGLALPFAFEHEPGTPLRLLDPVFQQACGGNLPHRIAGVSAACCAKAARYRPHARRAYRAGGRMRKRSIRSSGFIAAHCQGMAPASSGNRDIFS